MKMPNESFSGIITRMLERGVNWEWNAPKGKFVSEVFDPIGRVKTRWEKSNQGSMISRIDESKDGFRRDRIGMGSKWVSCKVGGKDENGINKNLEVFGDIIRLGLSDPQDRIGLVFADYNSQGDLVSTQAGNSSKEKPDVDPDEFYGRSLEENFKELAELIKYRGTVVMTTGFLYGLEDPSVEKQLESDKRDTEFESLKGEWGQNVVDNINRGFNAIMIPLIDESGVEESQPGSRDDILQLLGHDALRGLPHNFTDLSDSNRFLQIRDATRASLAQNLFSYHIRPTMIDQYFVKFEQKSADGFPRFAVHINSWGKDILSGEVAEGQIYRFEDQDYSIRRRDGKIIVAVEPIIRPQERVEVEFPIQIDAQRIMDCMYTEQNTEWEEALDLVPINIS